ncbi:Integrase catalytic region (plasmid) [Pantoea agglomerans]|nr:Integrase catalytic region [Pantoea agglomerans]
MNEVNRLRVIQDVVDRRLTTHLAAERPGISDRHCRRLLQRYYTDGPLGMADRRRGKQSNYQLPASLAEREVQIEAGSRGGHV